MLLQQLDGTPAFGFGKKTPGRRQTTRRFPRIHPQQKLERNFAQIPLLEFCESVGPKAREREMTDGRARLAGHANTDNRRDRVHQILKRLNLEGAIRWIFCRCFVQCLPPFFKATVRFCDCASPLKFHLLFVPSCKMAFVSSR
jgi:hypothetical protein